MCFVLPPFRLELSNEKLNKSIPQECHGLQAEPKCDIILTSCLFPHVNPSSFDCFAFSFNPFSPCSYPLFTRPANASSYRHSTHPAMSRAQESVCLHCNITFHSRVARDQHVSLVRGVHHESVFRKKKKKTPHHLIIIREHVGAPEENTDQVERRSDRSTPGE